MNDYTFLFHSFNFLMLSPLDFSNNQIEYNAKESNKTIALSTSWRKKKKEQSNEKTILYYLSRMVHINIFED